MEVLRVRDVWKRYGEVYALRGVSFSVSRGEIFGIIGPNGAGKTTLLKILIGIAEPTRGEVWINGLRADEDLRRIKRVIGYLAEVPRLYEEMVVRDYLRFFAELYSVPETEALLRAERVLQALGAFGTMNTRIGNLSKGFKRKVELARALLHNPEILLLDEPTSGIDAMSTISLKRMIRSLAAEGKTVVMATHNLLEAEQLCSRILMLNRGEVLAVGEPSEVIRGTKANSLEEAFVKLAS